MLAGALITLGVIGAVLVGGLVWGWLWLLNADREGLEPTNHIHELRKEDGGLGPMARSARAAMRAWGPRR